jgi:hypothetical protein
VTITKDQAATKLGCPAAEISEVLDTDAGTVFAMADGSSYILVPEDTPDSGGKTGLMYHQPPHDAYTGTFPVYQPLPDESAAIPDESTEQPPGDPEPIAGDGDPGDGSASDPGASPVPVRGKPKAS